MGWVGIDYEFSFLESRVMVSRAVFMCARDILTP